jgi:hypothetical protein
MIVSLIFLCVVESQVCVPIINGQFNTVEQCDRASNNVIAFNYQRMHRGELPRHIAFFECVDFGHHI